MKKALLIATAALASVSVFAAPTNLQKVRATSPMAAKMAEKATVTSVGDVKVRAEKSAVQRRQIDAGDYSFSPAVLLPTFSIWNNNVAYTNSETQEQIPAPMALTPANFTLKYSDNTYVYREDPANTPSFTDWEGIEHSWKVYSSPFVSGMTTVENEESVEVAYSNRGGFVYDVPVPSMQWKYGEYEYNTEEDYFSVMVNTIGEFSFDGSTITKLELDVMPVSSSLLDQRNCQSFEIGSEVMFVSGETATEGAEMAVARGYSSSFAQEFGEDLESVAINGFGFSVGYLGTPYILKSISVPAFRVASNGGKIHFTVKKGNTAENEVIFESDVKVVATTDATAGYATYFELPFESVDEDDIPVDYIIVDGPLLVEMTGLDGMELFAPVTSFYDENSNMLNTMGGFSAYTLATLKGATQSKDVYAVPSTLVWPVGKNQEYGYALGFAAQIDAEFPELDVVYAGAESPVPDVPYEASGVYTVNLTKEQNEATFFLTTTAELPEFIYVDEDELPSWVDYGFGDITREVNQSNGLIEVTMPVYVALSGEGADRAADLKLSYFNKEVTLRVAQGDAAGIAGVEAEGNGAVQYFDIQGRKLNAAPATGFFIQKQGSKVTKVIR